MFAAIMYHGPIYIYMLLHITILLRLTTKVEPYHVVYYLHSNHYHYLVYCISIIACRVSEQCYILYNMLTIPQWLTSCPKSDFFPTIPLQV